MYKSSSPSLYLFNKATNIEKIILEKLTLYVYINLKLNIGVVFFVNESCDESETIFSLWLSRQKVQFLAADQNLTIF